MTLTFGFDRYLDLKPLTLTLMNFDLTYCDLDIEPCDFDLAPSLLIYMILG